MYWHIYPCTSIIRSEQRTNAADAFPWLRKTYHWWLLIRVLVTYHHNCLPLWSIPTIRDTTIFMLAPAHYDDIKWKHFPRYMSFVRGIHWSPVNSPHRGQWREGLMFSFVCAAINGSVNNREGGDSRRHRAHYDVIVMDMSRLQIHRINIDFTSIRHESFGLDRCLIDVDPSVLGAAAKFTATIASKCNAILTDLRNRAGGISRFG